MAKMNWNKANWSSKVSTSGYTVIPTHKSKREIEEARKEKAARKAIRRELYKKKTAKDDLPY